MLNSAVMVIERGDFRSFQNSVSRNIALVILVISEISFNNYSIITDNYLMYILHIKNGLIVALVYLIIHNFGLLGKGAYLCFYAQTKPSPDVITGLKY